MEKVVKSIVKRPDEIVCSMSVYRVYEFEDGFQCALDLMESYGLNVKAINILIGRA